jgi:hypothetical protein
MGLKIHHDYAVLTACHPFGSNTCQNLNTTFNRTDWVIGNVLGILMNLTPVLLGAFAGAPVLARELETGTFRYAWTQGIGRARWTIAKLILLAVVVVAVTAAFGELFAWFFAPFIPQEDLTVYTASVFDTRPVAFAAWTLAAFALSAFFGMLFRRIIPAMAVTLGVYLGLALLAWDVRKYYPLSLVSSNPRSVGGEPVVHRARRPDGQPGRGQSRRRAVPDQQLGPAESGPRPARLHRMDAVHPPQPVLADAVRRGRLAARPLGPAHRGHRLARPPPRCLKPVNSHDRGPKHP